MIWRLRLPGALYRKAIELHGEEQLESGMRILIMAWNAGYIEPHDPSSGNLFAEFQVADASYKRGTRAAVKAGKK